MLGTFGHVYRLDVAHVCRLVRRNVPRMRKAQGDDKECVQRYVECSADMISGRRQCLSIREECCREHGDVWCYRHHPNLAHVRSRRRRALTHNHTPTHTDAHIRTHTLMQESARVYTPVHNGDGCGLGILTGEENVRLHTGCVFC